MRAVEYAAERFPEKAGSVRRLYLADERFRAICDDLALSVATLRRFEARPDAKARPEVEDYRALLAELEAELRRYLAGVGDA